MAKSLGEQYAGWCVHFNGIQHETCKQGINYRELAGEPQFGMAKRLPCIRSNDAVVVCAHCHYPTPDEVAAHEADVQAHMTRQREDYEAISAAHGDSYGTVYVCELCERVARWSGTSPVDFAAHAREAHSLTNADVRAATGRMASHMDTADWHQTIDRLALPDGRDLLLRSTKLSRRSDDKSLWRAETGRGRKRR